MKKNIIFFLVLLLLLVHTVYALKLSDETINDMTDQIYEKCVADSNYIGAICDEKGDGYQCEHSSSIISKSIVKDFLIKINDKYSKGGSYHGPVVLLCGFNGDLRHFLMLKMSCYEWDGGECINQVKEVYVTEKYYFKDFTLFGLNVVSNGGFTVFGFTLIGIGGLALISIGIGITMFFLIQKKK